MKTLKLTHKDVKAVPAALAAVADLEDGEYEFETNIGTIMVRKTTGETGLVRRNFYHEGSRITVANLKKALKDAPEKGADKEPEEAAPTGTTLKAKALDKKVKLKKLLKVLPESKILKKKKLAKAVEGFEKLGKKKMTGQEILDLLATIKKDIKTEKIVALFDLL